MAVGGMVGGGIFSTLGVVIGIAGGWAWLSFVVAGLIALAAGYSYVRLAAHYGEGGGAFTFLREIGRTELAGSLSWVLIVGYVLTNAVYAFTFGEYLGHVVGLGPWFPRLSAVGIIGAFVVLNLRGVGEAGGVETFLVWFKLVALLALAGWGLAHWAPPMLTRNVPPSGFGAGLFGAASVFMAYEGFQLLTYDYDDIDDPDRTLPRAVLSAIVVVIGVYVVVALGTAMLIGADQVIAHKEVALAIAGRAAAGTTGLLMVGGGVPKNFVQDTVVCAEILICTPTVSKAIEDGHFGDLYHLMNEGGFWGMQTMNQSLARYVKAGIIAEEVALANAGIVSELKQMLRH